MANPRRRRRNRRKSSSIVKHHRSRRRMNPFRRRRHSRNPGVAGFSAHELLNLTLGAGVGVLGSKYLTQAALGANNSGIMGYVGQAVATLAIAWGAGKWVSKDAAMGVIAGGGGALALRIFNDNVSGSSMAAGGSTPAMSGLGDPDMGRLGIGLGDFKAGMIPMPANWSAAPPPLPAPKKSR
jgi:hypothetical protein